MGSNPALDSTASLVEAWQREFGIPSTCAEALLDSYVKVGSSVRMAVMATPKAQQHALFIAAQLGPGHDRCHSAGGHGDRRGRHKGCPGHQGAGQAENCLGCLGRQEAVALPEAASRLSAQVGPPSPIKPAKQKIEMPTGEHTLRGGMYFPRQEGDARCDVCKTFRPSMALEHNHGGYQCIEAQVDP